MAHGPYGAEFLANIITEIFEPLVNCIYGYDGDITHFAGDAFQAIFPIENEAASVVFARALAAAKFIQHRMNRNSSFPTEYGTFTFTAKVGLSVGELEWGIIPGPNQHVYYFRGTAVDECTTAENLGKGGEIILHRGLYEEVQDWLTAVPVFENDQYLHVTAVNQQHPPPKSIIPIPPPSPYTAQFSPQILINSDIK